MKRSLIGLFLFFLMGSLAAQSTDDNWSAHKAKKWFKKKEWLHGSSFVPHNSINKTEFARQYHLNQAAWDKAFAFLRDTDLQSLSNGKHTIDGDDVYAIVSEAPTKDYDKTAFESHHRYIDLQYVISGEEKMSKAPVATVSVTKPYVESADIAYYAGDGKIYTVPAGTFMLFFPGEAHRPNITPGGNKVVKKIVIKIKASPANS